MFIKQISYVLGLYFLGFTSTLLLPLLLAAYYQFAIDPSLHPQPHSTLAFLLTILVSLSISGIFLFIGKNRSPYLFRREGLIIVALIWLLSPFIGALPFYFSGTLSNFLDCYFEAMSGFTTTGATVMHPKQFDPILGTEIPIHVDIPHFHNIGYTFWGTIEPVMDASGKIIFSGVEAVGKALLFWRCFSQWLGGMGIVVLFIAVLPALGVGGKVLFEAEVPGPDKEGLTPRIKDTAALLWKTYVFLTSLQIFLLLIFNPDLTFFEAITISFSTISTGGFSTRNTSIFSFGNPSTEWIVTIFMFLGGVNFSLYFFIRHGKFFKLNQPEFKLYLATLLGGSAFCFFTTQDLPQRLLNGDIVISPERWDTFRQSIFQYISAQTSTGFAVVNYDFWPYATQVILLSGMYFGGMAGSTGGGIKVIRYYLIFHILKNKVEEVVNPNSVKNLRIGNQDVHPRIRFTLLCYILIVIMFSILGIILLSIDGLDPETALGVNTCMINNIGIAFRMGSPDGSFAFLSNFGKILSIFWMCLGRIEFFALLVLFTPNFWRN